MPSLRQASWATHAQLAYALFVFIGPILQGGGWQAWLGAAGALLVFLGLVFDFRRQIAGCDRLAGPDGSTRVRRAQVDLLLMAALGFLTAPFNPGGATFIVYAAALAPLAWSPRHAVVVLLLLAIGSGGVWVFSAHPDRLVIGSWVIALIVIVGGGALFAGERRRQDAALRLAHDEVEEMAKVAERERIARDLHDLLGHTLSVIVLKAELASKLFERDPQRAAQEIGDIERVSRTALAEVRSAVEGYRDRGLAGELDNARLALDAAGVRLDATIAPITLSPRQETVLALVLRETVTNVVRHAGASVCGVDLGVREGSLVLTVHDNGVGGPLREGSGLLGMRERVVSAGGQLAIESGRGVTVRAQLPPEPAGAR
jgi:two-component system, NarL family, sensor histidine kinase DesK